MKYGIILDDAFLKHETPPGHPERKERLVAVAENLARWDRSAQLTRIDPVAAQRDWLLAVHEREHVGRVEETSGKEPAQLDPDTWAGPGSYQAALLAAGSSVHLTGSLLRGEIEGGFVLARPPGHHAESRRIMGFCLFNNVAVAAQWALSIAGLKRVAIVDFDVHHGNGTQEIFDQRPDVLYISIHQHPLYPGTGRFSEQGRGPGLGFTVNFPIPASQGNDFYFRLFDDFIIPILGSYRPELILVSAGFDAHVKDPLAGMSLDEEGFGGMAARLNAVAAEESGGRILYVLEGGYALDALSQSVRRVIATCLDGEGPQPAGPAPPFYEAYRRQALQAHRERWARALG